MNQFSREKGYTLLEIILVAAIFGVVVLIVARMASPMVRLFQRGRARQDSQLQARMCLETIERVLSSGKASTLVISTPVSAANIQESQADFVSVDGSSYTITWSSAPLNSVHLLQTRPGSLVANDTVLASHVTGLSFSWNDPAIISVTLQMRVPLDSSGAPDSFLLIQLPPQTIRMEGS